MNVNLICYADICRRDSAVDTVTNALRPAMTSSPRISTLITRAPTRMTSTPTATSDYVIYDDVYDENDEIVTPTSTEHIARTKSPTREGYSTEITAHSTLNHYRRFTFTTSSVAILARRSDFTAVAQQRHVMPVTSSSFEKFRKPAKSYGSRRYRSAVEMIATVVMSFVAFAVR
jgi:hypothetical protein